MLSLSVDFVLDMNNQLIVAYYQLIKSLLKVFKYFFSILSISFSLSLTASSCNCLEIHLTVRMGETHIHPYKNLSDRALTNSDKVFSFGQTPVQCFQ